MYSLETSIERLTRVGKTTSNRLKKIGINNVLDLLYYFPFRYEDYSQLEKISNLKPNQQVTVCGKLLLINNRRSSRKRITITEALIEDDTGSIKIIWFNQPFLKKNLKVGENIFISGQTQINNLELQFTSPLYEKVSSRNINTASIIPVYPLTYGLTQKQIRFLVNLILSSAELIVEWLPEKIRKENDLYGINKALKQIHFPKNNKELKRASLRLKFNELFLIQLQSQLTKKYLSNNKSAKIKFKEKEIKSFVKSLPFELTDDQKKTSWQILQDLEKGQPMNRLLEGDVGSGKTVVSAIVILNVILNNYQAVVMAPTEILAKQHYLSFIDFFKKSKINIGLFTRSEKNLNGKDLKKKEFLDKIKNNQIDLMIGTHALIQEDVIYDNLGLVIIDEQHRFGVQQRKKLKDKNKTIPHFLSMTATPIPRSLALILYGDLDLSIIKQMPKGRKNIITNVIEEKNRGQSYDFIKKEIQGGRQCFVICPLIDPSDKLGVKSVTQEFKKLDKDIFPDLKIGLLHGKLKLKEKEQIMNDFKNNKIKILVSTSVVEVGVDIPNASIMMIEGADRFGLAQLHQFRGRVGRGEYQSYCFLFTKNYSLKTRERLNALVKSTDGFALAEYDLKFRGPGEVYGVKQSGMPELKIANLNDFEIISLAKKIATDFMANNDISDFPLLEKKLDENRAIFHLE